MWINKFDIPTYKVPKWFIKRSYGLLKHRRIDVIMFVAGESPLKATAKLLIDSFILYTTKSQIFIMNN